MSATLPATRFMARPLICEPVGLTVASTAAAGTAEISCNVFTGVEHDHLLVPVARTNDASAP